MWECTLCLYDYDFCWIIIILTKRNELDHAAPEHIILTALNATSFCMLLSSLPLAHSHLYNIDAVKPCEKTFYCWNMFVWRLKKGTRTVCQHMKMSRSRQWNVWKFGTLQVIFFFNRYNFSQVCHSSVKYQSKDMRQKGAEEFVEIKKYKWIINWQGKEQSSSYHMNGFLSENS